jgi:hypothetical protein
LFAVNDGSTQQPSDADKEALMSATEIDQGELEAFMGQAVSDMGAAISVPLFMIGEELGL